MSILQATQFNFPTVIRFGEGVVRELPAYLQSQGWQRPLVVSDPNVAQLPFFQEIVADIQAAGIQTAVFTEMKANPVKSDVIAGGDAYKAH
ncbi:MAG: iron-containing alcohol dehydrogenase, partial [Bacteroidota bacterium]